MLERLTSFFENLQKIPMPGIYFVFPGRGKSKKTRKSNQNNLADPVKVDVPPALVVDTSALIDGRLADIANTGFLSGTFVVPDYILDELQKVADAKDALKRNRGRRGLDMLNVLKKCRYTKFKLLHTSKIKKPIDTRLLELAKQLNGRVVTTDYNLNKVGKVTGVPILNLNELSNMVKTILLPGEEFEVMLLKPGKDDGQAIGYLPDGTMVVAEGAANLIGETPTLEVERVWQTEAGRMVFARPRV